MNEPTRQVGRYLIVREIGRGGMAAVYLARQADLDRDVALKELNAFHAADPAFAERFVRESRVAGSMNHPNIVTVFEFLNENGTPYIAMEYLERGSLRPFVGHTTLAQTIGVLEGALAGLAQAERREIVHRDIKPENLMVTSDGEVKIADFGIAKAMTEAGGPNLTATGTTVGTPAYMAPEQATAGDVGPWTDLYSVGITAYEMTVERVPFHDSTTPVAVLMRQVSEEIPSAITVDPSVDRRFSDWIDRLLVKDPKLRTQSAREAWYELEEIAVAALGPLWRRDARLVVSGTDRAAGPLTPAPFERQTPPQQEASAGYETFMAEPAVAPPPPPPPPPVQPDVHAAGPAGRARGRRADPGAGGRRAGVVGDVPVAGGRRRRAQPADHRRRHRRDRGDRRRSVLLDPVGQLRRIGADGDDHPPHNHPQDDRAQAGRPARAVPGGRPAERRALRRPRLGAQPRQAHVGRRPRRPLRDPDRRRQGDVQPGVGRRRPVGERQGPERRPDPQGLAGRVAGRGPLDPVPAPADIGARRRERGHDLAAGHRRRAQDLRAGRRTGARQGPPLHARLDRARGRGDLGVREEPARPGAGDDAAAAGHRRRSCPAPAGSPATRPRCTWSTRPASSASIPSDPTTQTPVAGITAPPIRIDLANGILWTVFYSAPSAGTRVGTLGGVDVAHAGAHPVTPVTFKAPAKGYITKLVPVNNTFWLTVVGPGGQPGLEPFSFGG